MSNWANEDIKLLLKNANYDYQHSLRMEKLSKIPERKSYWHGKCKGLRDAILYLEWWEKDSQN